MKYEYDISVKFFSKKTQFHEYNSIEPIEVEV